MLVRKEVIRPGTYFYEDQDTGLPRKLTVTPEKVKHYFDSGKKMLGFGISVPAPLEHQPTAKPLTKADRAAQRLLNNAGYVQDYELDAENRLFGVINIEDDNVARKASAVKWTSPWITSFMDGDGRQWDEVIGHVALTTRPRITKQQPFPNIAAAMSFVGPLSEPASDPAALKAKGLNLSLAGQLKKDQKGVYRPERPRAFSVHFGVQLAAEEMDMPKEKKSKEAEKPTGDEGKIKPGEEPDASGTVDPSKLPLVEESLVDADGDISIHEVLCDLLEAVGICLEEGTDGTNFEERLYKAAMTHMKGASPAGDPMSANQPNTGTNDLPNNPPVLAESPPLYMSMEQVKTALNQVQDANTRKLIEAAFSMGEQDRKRAEALHKAALAAGAQKRAARIEAIVKKRPILKDRLIAQATNATLSLGDDGTVSDSMSSWLDILESEIKTLPALLTTPQAQLSAVDHPKEPEYGEMSEERRQAVLKEYCDNAHIKAPAVKAG